MCGLISKCLMKFMVALSNIFYLGMTFAAQ